ncbi:MFS transporter [Acetobacteraceae bacterium H6797]|nr:MFS transporter [Acetobacteraceae bacterium H6797]
MPPAATATATVEPATAPEGVTPFIEKGTAAFRRVNIAFFCAGFATFALLYCVQPLMPVFSADFHIDPAAASLSLSLPSLLVAASLLVAGSVAEIFGRKPVMVAGVLASALLTIAGALMPSWEGFLIMRALQGLALGGLPAVAMAYLGEEMHPRSLGLAMGLYISGNATGGMAGRVITGLLADYGGWRLAMLGMGILGLAAAILFIRNLAPSRHFTPRPVKFGALMSNFGHHLRDHGLRWLFLEGALLMGAFVTIYNYIGYRLMGAPFGLGQAQVGIIFTVYVVGIASSTLVGNLADRVGRPRLFWITVLLAAIGVALTAVESLIAIVAGLIIVTFGFFAAHSLASSWVGRRALKAKAQASALYLFCYYAGSALMGWAGGHVLEHWGWHALVATVTGSMLLALVIALGLLRLKPIAPPA